MSDWSAALVPLLSASLGAFLTYVFTSRTRRDESILRFKEEKYVKLLVKLQGFVGSTSSAQTKREFFEEQYQSWLYASDEVVEAINRMVGLVIIDPATLHLKSDSLPRYGENGSNRHEIVVARSAA